MKIYLLNMIIQELKIRKAPKIKALQNLQSFYFLIIKKYTSPSETTSES